MVSVRVNSIRYFNPALTENIPSLFPFNASKFSDFIGNKSSFEGAVFKRSMLFLYF